MWRDYSDAANSSICAQPGSRQLCRYSNANSDRDDAGGGHEPDPRPPALALLRGGGENRAGRLLVPIRFLSQSERWVRGRRIGQNSGQNPSQRWLWIK